MARWDWAGGHVNVPYSTVHTLRAVYCSPYYLLSKTSPGLTIVQISLAKSCIDATVPVGGKMLTSTPSKVPFPEDLYPHLWFLGPIRVSTAKWRHVRFSHFCNTTQYNTIQYSFNEVCQNASYTMVDL